VFGSGRVGKDVAQISQLDAMLDEHACRIATERALPPQAPSVGSKFMKVFDAPEHIDFPFHLSSIKTKARLLNRIYMRLIKSHGRLPKALKPNHTPEAIKKQRKLQRQVCRDVKIFGQPIPDALPNHDETHSSDANELETLPEDEDVTQRGRLGDLVSLAPFEDHFGYDEQTRPQRQPPAATKHVETPMGQNYLRQRTSEMEVEVCWSLDAMKAWAATLPGWRYAVQVMMYPTKTQHRSAKWNTSSRQKTIEEKQTKTGAKWAENDTEWDGLSRLRARELSLDEDENVESENRTAAKSLEEQSLF